MREYLAESTLNNSENYLFESDAPKNVKIVR